MQIAARVTVTPENLALRDTLDALLGLGFTGVGFSPMLRSPRNAGELPSLFSRRHAPLALTATGDHLVEKSDELGRGTAFSICSLRCRRSTKACTGPIRAALEPVTPRLPLTASSMPATAS